MVLAVLVAVLLVAFASPAQASEYRHHMPQPPQVLVQPRTLP